MTSLDDIAFWQREIDALSVGPDAASLVFNDGPMTQAARVWFILKPGRCKVGLQGCKRLYTALQDVQIFDARSYAEFEGTELKGNVRGGLLPSAVYLSHNVLFDGPYFCSAAELVQLLGDAQIEG